MTMFSPVPGDPKKYQHGLECLQHAIMSDCHMEQFNMDLLADLQIGLEKSGIAWPWSTGLHKK